MSQWKVIFATLVIFASGVFAGSLLLKAPVLLSVPTKPPEKVGPKRSMPWEGPARAESLQRMEKDLKLTSEQRDKIGAILAESHKRSRTIAEPLFAKMREEGQKAHDQIRAELTPEQAKRFDSTSLRGSGTGRGPFPSRGGSNDTNFSKKFPKDKRPVPPPTPPSGEPKKD